MNPTSPATGARPTPGLILGPFYPVVQPEQADHRLWRGQTTPTGARRLQLRGSVVDLAGLPLAGLTVELWHADPSGRYPHPAAPQSDQVDPDFLGYGRVTTDAAGHFAFDSLLPGGYQAANERRAVHVHVQITGRCERLVTQVFLPDPAANAADRWYRAVSRPECLLAEVLSDDADRLLLHWTAVLSRG